MTNVVNRFDEIFKVYVKNTMKNIEELKDFEMTSYIDDNSTPSFNFTCTFNEPYLYGLLNKKSDYLIFEVRNDTDLPTELLILNMTGEELASNLT
jgi:hypothetical protein